LLLSKTGNLQANCTGFKATGAVAPFPNSLCVTSLDGSIVAKKSPDSPVEIWGLEIKSKTTSASVALSSFSASLSSLKLAESFQSRLAFSETPQNHRGKKKRSRGMVKPKKLSKILNLEPVLTSSTSRDASHLLASQPRATRTRSRAASTSGTDNGGNVTSSRSAAKKAANLEIARKKRAAEALTIMSKKAKPASQHTLLMLLLAGGGSERPS
jgi:hypothetical protein